MLLVCLWDFISIQIGVAFSNRRDIILCQCKNRIEKCLCCFLNQFDLLPRLFVRADCCFLQFFCRTDCFQSSRHQKLRPLKVSRQLFFPSVPQQTAERPQVAALTSFGNALKCLFEVISRCLIYGYPHSALLNRNSQIIQDHQQ